MKFQQGIVGSLKTPGRRSDAISRLIAGLAVFQLCGFLALAATLPTSADFYVSTKGNDAWSGRLSGPNREGTDGPFATLAKARDAVRSLKRTFPASDIRVLIR